MPVVNGLPPDAIIAAALVATNMTNPMEAGALRSELIFLAKNELAPKDTGTLLINEAKVLAKQQALHVWVDVAPHAVSALGFKPTARDACPSNHICHD